MDLEIKLKGKKGKLYEKIVQLKITKRLQKTNGN